MFKPTFMRCLAVAFLLLTGVMWAWQNPGLFGHPLTPEETDRYVAGALANLPTGAEDAADLERRLRAFAAADDGRPVYMLNLMRFYPAVKALPRGPSQAMTPAESNARYESTVRPMLLGVGGTAPFVGHAVGANVLPFAADGDAWSRMLVIRYPSRRAFLELVSDPAYGPIAPYKLAALETILAPMAAEMMMPDLVQATAASLVVLFLATGWWRASRRQKGGLTPPRVSSVS